MRLGVSEALKRSVFVQHVDKSWRYESPLRKYVDRSRFRGTLDRSLGPRYGVAHHD